jgi:hypothetical protein
MLFAETASEEDLYAPQTAGTATPLRTMIMPITTSSSINVKAWFCLIG